MVEGVPSSSGCMLCGRIRLQTIMRMNRSTFRAKGGRLARFHNFHMKAQARIWPRLSYARQDDLTVARGVQEERLWLEFIENTGRASVPPHLQTLDPKPKS